MKSTLKKITALILMLSMVLACGIISFAEDDNSEIMLIEEELYTYPDVSETAWYYNVVVKAGELGLMKGTGEKFNPKGSVTRAQAIAIADRIHDAYFGTVTEFEATSPWYRSYVDYALECGILKKESSNYNAEITRSEFAAILSAALPDEALPAKNQVKDYQLPDVLKETANSSEIYRLYRAGIVSGKDEYGTFSPYTSISRCEACAIAVRMSDSSERLSFTLKEVPVKEPVVEKPDVPLMERKDNAFFSGSAMLGNSLVQGMKIYSGLDTMDFYCRQSLTVFTIGEYADQLCKTQYKRVYICLGCNEVYLSAERFTSKYAETIDKIKKAMPSADIYIMSITPVTADREAKGVFSQKKIHSLNAALRQLAKDKGCWYLDTCTPLESGGYLKSAYAGWDGSPHLSEAGYKAWAEAVRTHYVK